jgi:hypothetical protein
VTIEDGPGAGVYHSDPASTSSNCVHNADGSWRLIYAGGDPWFSIDLIVGQHASQAGGSSEVALEVDTGPGYLWIDPADLRGGDKPGRSKVTIEVRAAGAATTFLVAGTTPNRAPTGDGPLSTFAMEASCPIV